MARKQKENKSKKRPLIGSEPSSPPQKKRKVEISKPINSDRTGYVLKFDRIKGIGSVQCDDLDEIVTLQRSDLGSAARNCKKGTFVEIAERIVFDIVDGTVGRRAKNVRSFKFSHCNLCGAIGHYWKTCPQGDGKIKCYICGKQHKSKECPLRLTMKGDGCFICKSQEHKSMQCPKIKIKIKTMKCSKCGKDGHHALTCGYKLLATRWYHTELLLKHPEIDIKGKWMKKRNDPKKKKKMKAWLKANKFV